MIALISTVLLWAHVTSTSVHNDTFTIGDTQSEYNTELLTFGSSVLTVTITLKSANDRKVFVYHVDEKPIKEEEHLPIVPMKTLTENEGVNYLNYNYNKGEEALYLMSQSTLTYNIIAYSDALNNSGCSSKLFLFSNETNYKNFRNTNPFKSFNQSICFPANESGIGSNWTFEITKSFSYYVGLEIFKGHKVSGNVSAVRAYYNTTGLAKPSECKNPLTADEPSCTITYMCSDQLYCNNNESYLLIDTSGSIGSEPTEIEVIYKERNIVIPNLVFGVIMIMICLIAIVVFVFIMIYYKNVIALSKCKHEVIR